MMLAGTASPELTLLQLHMSQALAALATEDLADAQHHAAHAQDLVDASQEERIAEIRLLLDQGDVHGAEHEIEEYSVRKRTITTNESFLSNTCLKGSSCYGKAMTLNRPIPDSYWVYRGSLLAGEYPGSPDDDEAIRNLRSFLEAGVNVFIDLTEEGELEPYLDILNKESDNLGISVRYQRRPIRDLGVPTAEEMVTTLNAIDEAIESGAVVYVHCWGGIGRTGTVIGCYLVRHGMTGFEALEQIEVLRRGMSHGWE